VYVPNSLTEAETFLWFDAAPDLTLGIAHLSRQNAFRFLGSYRFVRETARMPSVHVSVGVQGIGTGNPGWSGRLEKNFRTSAGNVNVFAGVGLRSNEDHAHPLGGIKLDMPSRLAVGLQWDGHNSHPFVTQGFGQFIVGFYLVGGRSPGYLVGARF
jgi:hypothetical protein